MSDAFAAALLDWPKHGVPDRPEAWLMAVARRKAIDAARRRRSSAEAAGHLQLIADELRQLEGTDGIDIPDDRLALMFVCAHPAIDPAIRPPLMLQTVLGFDAATIASAFLVLAALIAPSGCHPISEAPMRRFILTGAPGSGKTAIIRQLELDGFSVVEESATDIIALEQARGVAEPWKHPSFIDLIVELQRQRQVRASRETDEIQFHDRSAICTAALAVYLGYPLSDALSRELKRVETAAIYQKRVFFIQKLGFITPTEARCISFEEALRFECVHEENYRNFGFELVPIPPGSLLDRVDAIKRSVRSGQSLSGPIPPP